MIRRNGLSMASVLAVALVLISVAVGGSRIEAEGEIPPSQTVVTVIGDFSIRPGYVTADLGADVTLRVVNLGTVPHNVTVTDGPRTPLLRPGEMALLHVGKLTDLKILYCSLPGHRERGVYAPLGPKPGQVAFEPPPVFSAEGNALATYRYGSIDELETAVRGAGASAVWMQDLAGRFHALILDGPPFLRVEIETMLPDGVLDPMSVLLVR